MFTGVHHWYLSCARWMQPTLSSHFLKINFILNIVLKFMPVSSGFVFNFICISRKVRLRSSVKLLLCGRLSLEELSSGSAVLPLHCCVMWLEFWSDSWWIDTHKSFPLLGLWECMPTNLECFTSCRTRRFSIGYSWNICQVGRNKYYQVVSYVRI